MTDAFTEKDWKYIRSIKPELLGNLCERINRECEEIIADQSLSSHERYLKLYKHIRDSDEIIADCFNDLKRSNLFIKVLCMNRHGLLTENHLAGLCHATQEIIKEHSSIS